MHHVCPLCRQEVVDSSAIEESCVSNGQGIVAEQDEDEIEEAHV